MIVSKNVLPVWVEGKQAYMELANIRSDGVVRSGEMLWATIRAEDESGEMKTLFEFDLNSSDLLCAVENARNTNMPFEPDGSGYIMLQAKG